MEEKIFNAHLDIYKPNKKKTGGAIRFVFSKEAKTIFLEGATQVGEMRDKKVFDWENRKVIFAIKTNDIFLIRSFLRMKASAREEEPLKIYHKFLKDGVETSTVLNIANGRNGFYLSMMQGDNKVGVPVTSGEMECVNDLFRVYIYKIYG